MWDHETLERYRCEGFIHARGLLSPGDIAELMGEMPRLLGDGGGVDLSDGVHREHERSGSTPGVPRAPRFAAIPRPCT